MRRFFASSEAEHWRLRVSSGRLDGGAALDRVAGVSAQKAREAAQAWIEETRLPEDLRDRVVQLAVFRSEEDCRFFFPRRAMSWQQMVNTELAKTVRKRKGKVARVPLTRAVFEAWRQEANAKDTPEERYRFAASFQRLLEVEAAQTGDASDAPESGA